MRPKIKDGEFVGQPQLRGHVISVPIVATNAGIRMNAESEGGTGGAPHGEQPLDALDDDAVPKMRVVQRADADDLTALFPQLREEHRVGDPIWFVAKEKQQAAAPVELREHGQQLSQMQSGSAPAGRYGDRERAVPEVAIITRASQRSSIE